MYSTSVPQFTYCTKNASLLEDKGLLGRDTDPYQEARAKHVFGRRNLSMKTHFQSASVWPGSTDVMVMHRYATILRSMILFVSLEIQHCWLKCVVQALASQITFRMNWCLFLIAAMYIPWAHSHWNCASASLWPLELYWCFETTLILHDATQSRTSYFQWPCWPSRRSGHCNQALYMNQFIATKYSELICRS